MLASMEHVYLTGYIRVTTNRTILLSTTNGYYIVPMGTTERYDAPDSNPKNEEEGQSQPYLT
jgi:hypothetical protein